jgi:hypothetical protein
MSTKQPIISNAFTIKPDNSKWIRQQEILNKRKKAGQIRAKNTDGNALNLKFTKYKDSNND